MSSEIRAGDVRTYWIISNGHGYVDGVTDPDLVTTVGNGWYIHWIGSDHDEYKNACVSVGIVPRNMTPNTPTVNDIIDGFDPYLMINTLSQKLETFDSVKSKVETIDPVSIPGQRLSATQIRLWLIQNNINLQNVYDAINTIEDVQTRESVLTQWEYAPYIDKSHPMLIPLASALGLTNADVERAFTEGSSL